MQNFEIQLCDTVDSILLLLGHQPSLPTNASRLSGKAPPLPSNAPSLPSNISTDLIDLHRADTHVHQRKGPRLVKSPHDLAKLLEKM